MSTYRKIHGRSIQAVTTDPSETVAEGQVWYNTTSNTFKSVISSTAWASATSLPETNSNAGGAGIQTAALFFGGRSGGAQKTQTLEYNGLGYSAGGAMGTARNQMGTGGTQTAAVAATGKVESPPSTPADTEEYNGTSWSEQNNVSTARFASGGAGTQTALVIAGGRLAPGTWTDVTEEYDGTSWTNGGALNQSKTLGGSMTGSLTATVSFGGDGNPPAQALNDLTFYDGTSWTETGNIPTATRNPGSGGPQTAAIYFGGKAPSETANTFLFDGTSFSATGSMGAATYIMAPAANASDNKTALSMGGYGGSAYLSRTEEFTSSANVITAAAFASGGVLPASWYGVGASQFGTQNSGLSFGGNNPGAYTGNTASFLYNGSSWTATPSLSTARAYLSGFGTSTSAVGAGGATGPGAKVTSTEEYDGSSWTNGGALGTARSMAGTAGASITSGVFFGGAEPAVSNKTEEYDGSSWTAVNTMPTTMADAGGNGIQTSAIAAGTSSPTTLSLEYDGTNWATGGSLSVVHKKGAFLGTSSDSAIVAGGYASPQTAVEGYDGTAWSTRPSLATARGRAANVGTASLGFVAGGNPSATNATEEWTGETSTLNVKTLTQS